MNPSPPESAITLLLQEASEGNEAAAQNLIPLVYDRLQQIAHQQLRSERSGHTLNTGDLVHESYLKLIEQRTANWQNRAHFFAIASQAMRRILIDYAKRRNAAKRGDGIRAITLNEEWVIAADRHDQLIALDEAMLHLTSLNERQGKVVEYAFFGGLKHEEIAHVLGVSLPTVRRDWRMARAWLSRQLKEEAGNLQQ